MEPAAPAPVHVFGDDVLGTLDATALAELVRRGDVSRREVVEAAVARAEAAQALLNPIATADYERALAAAAEPARSGPFSGVPTFVKDNVDVVGLPTHHGSGAFTSGPAVHSSPPAKQHLGTGLVNLGKSRMPEFGLTASTEFLRDEPTRNPWDPRRSAGASSGGAAVLVASGVVPIAHGNDGGGSIRIPAAVNGLVGLKPSRGRLLDRESSRRIPVNLVAEGVLTRTVRDTARYLAACEEQNPQPALRPVGLVEGPGVQRLRIGVITHDVYGDPVHREVAAVLQSAAERLASMGHHVEPRHLVVSQQFVTDFLDYWSLLSALLCADFSVRYPRTFRAWRIDPLTRGLVRRAGTRAAQLPTAVRRLRAFEATMERQLEDIDVLLTPVTAHPAPLLGVLRPDQPYAELMDKLVRYVGFTPPANIAGAPAISVPHGMMPCGLPGSVQLGARPGEEATLLALAYELEADSPFPSITNTAGMPLGSTSSTYAAGPSPRRPRGRAVAGPGSRE